MNSPLDRLRANVGIALALLLAAWLLARPPLAAAAIPLLLLAALDLPPSGLLAALWVGTGRAIGRMVAPVALFALYFLFFTPWAFVHRLLHPGAARRFSGEGETSLWRARPKERPTTDFTQPW